MINAYLTAGLYTAVIIALVGEAFGSVLVFVILLMLATLILAAMWRRHHTER